MALPSSGELSFSGLNNHIRRPDTQALSLNDAQIRGLAQKPSGAIAVSDLYGKWAGTRLTCVYDSVNTRYGFIQGIGGSIEGDFAGSNLRSCHWVDIPDWHFVSLETVSGAAQPTSRTLKITDDNFNVIATYTLTAWTLSNGVWSAVIAASTNPFPAGTKRWLTW